MVQLQQMNKELNKQPNEQPNKHLNEQPNKKLNKQPNKHLNEQIKNQRLLAKACASNRIYFISSNIANSTSMMYFKGHTSEFRPRTDTDLPFRQESNFLWLFGVQKPGYTASINIETGYTTLFCPLLSNHDKVWTGGDEMTPAEMANYYLVDAVCYSKKITLPNALDKKPILDTIKELRLIKSKYELALIKKACSKASKAHRTVMRKTYPRIMESQQAHLFYYVCKNKFHAYEPICASGRNAAILHYQDNSALIKDGDLCLLDMGTEVNGYASDITVTFPSNGKFTDKQANIYNIVLVANRSVFKQLNATVTWGEMHNLAAGIILRGLKELGIVKNNCDPAIVKTFMPHGLGHHLGIE